MRLLRFGEPDGNSSLRDINSRLRVHKELAGDLRLLVAQRSMPRLNPDVVTLVEDWTIENYVCPMLVGRFRDPTGSSDLPADWLSFSTPLELISVGAKAARSLTQWYRLGEPSPLAKDAVDIWSFPDGR
ncbi:hypothetical protein [Rhizobium leguminosarum]|uniref:hypothetical protein n=1 Tax=Rhizobium leguminosarum TaxID=384 RepID=UPI00144271CE|nr:hypothetical protein [Rhizobium leguminosarum]MBY5448095.1 hypothetical protein [Rhizobium leguminosarum]NKK32364.1 hypothetical protein [Rhizobium leguminosarum bv. viciae]